MPIRINDGSVVTSFSETIAGAGGAGPEAYLRAVAKRIQQLEPPVTLAKDAMLSGTYRINSIPCLAVVPTKDRLRHYKTAHYQQASGNSLSVGWYLVGAEHADGIGFMGIGAINDLEVNEVMAIIQTVHEGAVLPAIQEVADSFVRSPGASGFFGL